MRSFGPFFTLYSLHLTLCALGEGVELPFPAAPIRLECHEGFLRSGLSDRYGGRARGSCLRRGTSPVVADPIREEPMKRSQGSSDRLRDDGAGTPVSADVSIGRHREFCYFGGWSAVVWLLAVSFTWS